MSVMLPAASKRILALAAVLLFTLRVWAHDPGLSGANGRLQNGHLEITLSFSIRDAGQLVPLDANQDGQVTPGEFTRSRDRLIAVIATNCEVAFNGVIVQPTVTGSRQDDAKNVSVQFEFPVSAPGQLSMDFKIIRALPFGHRMFFALSDATGNSLAERLLAADDTRVSVALAAVAAPPEKTAHTLTDFVLMGVEHIGTGYDHLLFLFALLVVTRTFRSALAVITAFTVAHSITLALATFNVVNFSSGLTEPLIAATIVYVGLENLVRRGDPHKRWLLTFAFGLIHGFGFASALREMGVGERAGGVVMPLFGFNLGVELGQLTVAAIVLPLVWKLRKRENFLRYGVPACSIAVALAGSFWFIQRVWFSS